MTPTAVDVRLTRLSSVKPEKIKWGSPGRVAFGKIALIDSDPGEGKSTLVIDWGARGTRGFALPGGEPMEPFGVVVLSPEDGIADTIRPRFEAAGADLDKVVVFEGIGDPLDPLGVVRLPTLPHDVELIRAAVKQVGARMIIIDPLFAMLGADISSKVDQDVRRALTPLARLADEEGIAVIIIRHLNKSAGGSPMYRGGGSIGIIGLARLAMLVGRDPDDPEVRVLASTKTNIAKPPPSLKFRLVPAPTNPDVAIIEYLGESAHSASRLLQVSTDADRESGGGALDEAKEWLSSYLAGGSQLANRLKQNAETDGIKPRTLDRAKAEIGVKAYRSGGFGSNGAWYWRLPSSHDETPKSANKSLSTPKDANENDGDVMANIGDHMTESHVVIAEDEVDELVRSIMEEGPAAIDVLRQSLHTLDPIDRAATLMAIERAERALQEAA